MQLEESDRVYTFEYYNEKLPKIQTGAVLALLPIILLILSIIIMIGTGIYIFIKSKKNTQ